MTFIAALRHDRITAPLLLQGAMNGQIFRAYVEQMLAPTLKTGRRGHHWTRCGCTRSRVSARPSKREVPRSRPFQLTAQVSTRLNSHSVNSRHVSAPRPPGQPLGCSPPSAPPSRASLRANAPLISLMQGPALSPLWTRLEFAASGRCREEPLPQCLLLLTGQG
jgi:hypothetical protein